MSLLHRGVCEGSHLVKRSRVGSGSGIMSKKVLTKIVVLTCVFVSSGSGIRPYKR